MTKQKKFIAGGCSCTFGHELSDDEEGKPPSRKSWAYGLRSSTEADLYICTARPGAGNSGIARRVFNAVTSNKHVNGVVVMWSFLSRYDWAMPRHRDLEKTRWASLSPWDTETGSQEAFKSLSESSEQQEQWKIRDEMFKETGVRDFANAIYKYAANQYHETYLGWKSIIWLQNILEKKQIPYMFTLADNTLFYDQLKEHKNQVMGKNPRIIRNGLLYNRKK